MTKCRKRAKQTCYSSAGQPQQAREITSQKFTCGICGNDWWENCHKWGPGITAPSASCSKAVRQSAQAVRQTLPNRNFWRASLLLKVIPLWCRCGRKMWRVYSAHKVKSLTGGRDGRREEPGEPCRAYLMSIRHVPVWLNMYTCLFLCLSIF